MGFPWRKVYGGIKAGLAIGAAFDPHIAVIDAAVTGIEAKMPHDPGADKKATVEAISDAALDQLPITADQKAQIQALRSTYIDLTVRERNIIAEAEATRQQLSDLIDSFKKAAA